MLPTNRGKTRVGFRERLPSLVEVSRACPSAHRVDRRGPRRAGHPLQRDPRCRRPPALPDGPAGGRRAHRPADRPAGAAQRGGGVAGAQAVPGGRGGGGGPPAPAGASPGRAPGVGGRVAPGDRAGSARGGGGPRQLDDRPAGRLPGSDDRARDERRGRAPGPAPGGLRLQAPRVDAQAQGPGAAGVGGKRLRVEALLAAAASPLPPPAADLVPDPALADLLPEDLPRLLALLPGADLYLQDEVEVALHPTLTRVWCPKGRRGQRLVEAPGTNAKRYGFGLVDWRDGWLDWSLEAGRRATPFCAQLRRAVARSAARGRIAVVLLDNLSIHTPHGSRLLRALLAEVGDRLRLVYTPTYDPDANRIEWLWRSLRRAVTHNHQRATLPPLLADADRWAAGLRAEAVLSQIGSPFAPDPAPHPAAAPPGLEHAA